MINQVLNAAGGGLDALMNLVPTPGKVAIIPVRQYAPVPVPSGIPPYIAMFNPDQWNEQQKFVYHDEQEHGTNTGVQKFNYIRSRDLSFEILIDGTGASGEKKEVTAELLLLKNAVGFNGSEHRPNKLFIIWGYFFFRGVIETLDIQYTLFRPNGTPLRAKVKLSFKEDTDNVLRVLDMNLQSADLTHRRLVKTHDRLDLLSHYIYKDSRFYMEVARTNGLTSVRKLPVGTELVFPPTEK